MESDVEFSNTHIYSHIHRYIGTSLYRVTTCQLNIRQLKESDIGNMPSFESLLYIIFITQLYERKKVALPLIVIGLIALIWSYDTARNIIGIEV